MLPLLVCGGLLADVPLPRRLLNPASAAEAWNVIRMAVANGERLLAEKRLDEITDQVVLCSPALRVLAGHGVVLEKQRETDENTARAFSLVNIVVKESMAGNQAGAENAFAQLRAVLRALAEAFDPKLVESEIYACPDHPDSLSTEPGQTCGQCARPLLARRIPYSFIYVKPGKPSLRLEAGADAPLQPGRAATITLRLRRAGAAVTPDDLLVTHSAPVHLLLADEALRDFHHLLPAAGDAAGEFSIAFTPAADGPYRLWVGVVPAATGLQEYLAAVLPGVGGGAVAVERQVVTVAEAGGFRFQLLFAGAGPPRAEKTLLMRLHVTGGDGKPVARLEPVRNAFAHITGIYDDLETVAQLHPVGGDILREDLRGGPYLAFKFYPPKVGFVRLFCEVRLDGRTIIVPFGVEVVE